MRFQHTSTYIYGLDPRMYVVDIIQMRASKMYTPLTSYLPGFGCFPSYYSVREKKLRFTKRRTPNESFCVCVFFVVFLMRVVVWWCFILGTYTYMYMRVLFNVKMRAPSILAAAVRCGVVSIKRIIDRCVYNFWTVRRERGSFSFYTRAHTFYIIYTSYFEYMYVHAVWDFIIFIKTNTYSHTHTQLLWNNTFANWLYTTGYSILLLNNTEKKVTHHHHHICATQCNFILSRRIFKKKPPLSYVYRAYREKEKIN